MVIEKKKQRLDCRKINLQKVGDQVPTSQFLFRKFHVNFNIFAEKQIKYEVCLKYFRKQEIFLQVFTVLIVLDVYIKSC